MAITGMQMLGPSEDESGNLTNNGLRHVLASRVDTHGRYKRGEHGPYAAEPGSLAREAGAAANIRAEMRRRSKTN